MALSDVFRVVGTALVAGGLWLGYSTWHCEMIGRRRSEAAGELWRSITSVPMP